MTTEQIIGLVVALVIMLVGIVGAVVPILPGTPLILVAAIAHKLYFGQAGASWWIIVILVVLTALSFLLDHLASMIGAKKLGATWRGITGAIVGGIAGLFFGLPGILLGPFVGAMLFELLGGQEFKPAARAGLGATLGLLVGAVAKVSLSVAMTVLFTVSTMWRSG